jgi:hypothetical protein
MKPQALAQSNKVSLSLAALNPGAVFSFFDKKVLDGILFQKRPVSSALNTCSGV